MPKSIFEDIKEFFQNGNMLTKIILFNIIAFVLLAILRLIFKDSFSAILTQLMLNSDLEFTIKHPWTIIISTFVNFDIFHFIFLLFIYYWFGNIVGDMIGDKKILPLYILGGLTGVICFILYGIFVPTNESFYGLSSAVLTSVSAAIYIAPKYKLKLILLGSVPILYIGIVVVLIAFGKTIGTGNHISQIGSLITGVLFIYLLKRGIDLTRLLNKWLNRLISFFTPRKTKLVVVSRGNNIKPTSKNKISQETVDKLLDKVKSSGYESLNASEKEMLFRASNTEEN